MKEFQLSGKVIQKLNEFESLGNIQPSAEWNQSLLNRISSNKPSSISGFSAAKFALAVIIIILINIGFVLNSVTRNSNQIMSRDRDLQIISNELLINPISFNN